MHRLLRLAGVAALVCAGGLASAHDDDPKILDREEPYRGIGFRRAALASPGSLPTGQGGGTANLGIFDAVGVQLLAWMPLSEFGNPQSGSDCWGYTSPSGREYALFTHYDGMAVVEVTNPANPQLVRNIVSIGSLWHDVKVYQDKCYLVSEGGGGILVYDLANVDAGQVPQVGQVTSGGGTATHNVAIDEVSGFLYRTGGDSNGLRIYDLNQSLTNPPLVGSWSTRYVHDAQIVTYTSGPYAGRQIAFCCSGFNGGFTQTGLDVLDVTNKNNIQVLANRQYTSGAYSHQGWLSEDRQYFYLNDELDEGNSLPTRTIVFDVSNLNNPQQASIFTNGNAATGHNLYTRGDLLFEANYRSGMRVFDLAQSATNPPEVAYFDTYPGSDSDAFNGLWSVYPYFQSGTVLGSDLERGLFVWYVGPTPLTLDIVGGAPTQLSPAGDSFVVQITEDQPGNLAAGSARLHYDAGAGWQTVPMAALGGNAFQASFPAIACGSLVEYYVSADSTTGGTWTSPAGAPNETYTAVAATGLSTIADDALESASGWTGGVAGDTATTGIWTRVNPNGTDAQPEDDHSPSGTVCWVTGQGSVGGSIGENDVDNGFTTLLSPVYDLSGTSAPTVSYWRWYLNDGNGTVDDRFVVQITDDGTTWVDVEVLGPTVGDTSGGWFQHSFSVADFVGLTSTVRLRFIAEDIGTGSIVEAAIDDFVIEDVQCGPCSGPVVQRYCTGNPNSTGGGALIDTAGSTSLAANDFSLYVSGAVPSVPGIFFYGGGQSSTPFGDGVRCVAAGGLGIFRLNPAQVISVFGDLSRPVDLTAPPAGSGAGQIQAGDTWNFQFWYRDVAAGGAGFNLSDAVSVTFCP